MKSPHPVVAVAAQEQDLPLLSATAALVAAVVAVVHILSLGVVALHQLNQTRQLTQSSPLLDLVVALIELPPTVHPVVVVALLLLVLLDQPVQVARVAQADLFGDLPTLAVEAVASGQSLLLVLEDQVLVEQAVLLEMVITQSPTQAAVAAAQPQLHHLTRAAMAATDSSLSGMLACPSHRVVSSPTQADTPTTTSTQRTSTTF